MTDTRRRIALAAAGAFAVVLVLLVAIPYIFRDRIAARVHTEINRNVQADVNWGGAGLSLIRNFPNATLRLDDLAVVGHAPFQGDTLAHVGRFHLALDLPSVVRSLRGTGPLVIRSIDVDRPDVRLLVLEDGTANWDLLRGQEDEPAGEASPLSLSLRRLDIREGNVSLTDRSAGLTASVVGLRHSLAGDFEQTRFAVATTASADSVSVRFAGIPYLSRTRLGLDADLDVDLEAGHLTVRKTDVRLNDLLLALRGSVGLGETTTLDLAFDTPGTDFQQILSLVPAVYRQDFQQLRASGTMAVNGTVRGQYGEGAFPALALRASVQNGWFQYPDLPLPARDVFLDLAIDNPGGDVDNTVVSLQRFHVVIGNDPVEGSFRMRTPVSDPAVELAVRGRLDLADLNRTLKLQGTEELTGALAADARMNARLSDVDAQRYDRVHAEGFLDASRVTVRTEALPHPLQVEEGRLRFTPQFAELAAFRGRIGSSDVDMTGRLDNLLGFALRDEVLRGRANIASAFFDLDEWRGGEGELDAVVVPGNLDFDLTADVQRLSFADLDLRDARGALRIQDARATLDGFRMAVFGGTMSVTGYYDTRLPQRPTFDVALGLDGIDVAQAAGGVATVRALAPVARYARGSITTDVRLAGALDGEMNPLLEALSGRGSFEAAGLSIHGFPVLERLADVLRSEALRNPALSDVRSSFTVQDGRLHVSPFDVNLGQYTARVSGSHGLDQSLDYTLGLQVPAALLGADANRAIATLASQAGRAGLNFQPAEVISLGVRLGGTVTDPSVTADFRGTTALAQQVGSAVREEVDRRVDALEARADAALVEARRRAEAEGARLVDEATRQAARLRAEAAPLAEAVRREGYEQADGLVARATNPAARIAAQAGANRLRREADEQADRILREADTRAEALVAEAQNRSNALLPTTGGTPPGS